MILTSSSKECNFHAVLIDIKIYNNQFCKVTEHHSGSVQNVRVHLTIAKAFY